MELKYLQIARENNAWNGLNRTFMELKYYKSLDIHLQGDVLIEPLWN